MIKHAHPITVIYKLYSQIRYSIIPLAVFLYNEIRSGTGQQPDWVYFAAAFYGFVIGSWSLLSWYRETYRFDQHALHITKGVFTVTQRTIPLLKISNIKIEQSWLYRLLRIANVELQTSDSNEDADASLVISLKTAEFLEKSIKPNKQRLIPLTKEHDVTRKEIMMMSISSNTFWLGLPVTMAVFQYLWRWLSPTSVEDQVSFTELYKTEIWSKVTLDDVIKVTVYLTVFLGICLVVTWLFSIGMAQIRYKGWRLSRIGDEIFIHHGWVGRKSVQIQVERIQSVRIRELMIGRLCGYASVCMDCVGYSGERRVKLLIPSIRTSELVGVLGRLLPEIQLPIPQRTLHRNAKLVTAIPVLSFLALGITVGCYFTLFYLAFVPILYILYKYMTYVYVNTKWEIEMNLFTLSKAGFNQTTVHLLRESIESISIKQLWWQKVFRVYQLELGIDSPAKAREYRMMGITKQYCDEILSWYKNKKYESN